MTSFPPTAAIALNRFGLGARPDEPLPADPKRWLLAQFESYQPLPRGVGDATVERLAGGRLRRAAARGARRQRRNRGRRPAEARAPKSATATARRSMRGSRARSSRRRRSASGWCTSGPITSRSRSRSRPLGSLAGSFEAEAIRPHVFGRFEDMLLAVERHPAMLALSRPGALDRPRERRRPARRERRPGAAPRPEREPRARGPGAAHARRAQRLRPGRRDRARARAHRLERRRARRAPTRRARARCRAASRSSRTLHEPGARIGAGRALRGVRAKRRPQAILRKLAVAPATARHVATKLARHFAPTSRRRRWSIGSPMRSFAAAAICRASIAP